jgi:hypothetical protein
MPESLLSKLHVVLPLLAAVLFTIPMQGVVAAQQQEPVSAGNQEKTALWKSDHAKYLIGLTEVRPKAEGALVVTPTEVRFDSNGQHAVIAIRTLIAVGVGDERVERGGTAAKIARMGIYDGGGVALAAVLHHVVDLLTIEYRGNRGEYHGVVFVLPRNEATAALTQLASLIQTPSGAESRDTALCTLESATLKSVTVEPIAAQLQPGAVAVPLEYKVLLYEHVVQRLKQNPDLDGVYRFDAVHHARTCSQYSAEVTVTAFKKGDNAVRASTGPLGIFLGTTALAYDLRIRTADGNIVLERNIKSVVRGESESLDISGRIAKTIAKAFVKVQNAHPEPPAAKPQANS